MIKPVFLDLSKDTLLVKCFHGKTQNANEALNNLIWTKCPKNVYVEREDLEMGVCSVIINFDDEACDTFISHDISLPCIVIKRTAIE